MEGLLNGQQIKARCLIQDSAEESFLPGSYDITIGDIIAPGGEIKDSYTIPPGGIVEVVSRERVTIPPDVLGYALIKTSLCNEGVLALSIGIVDPGYDGKLSSAILNFGQNFKILNRGDVFLRLTFHTLSNIETVRPSRSLSNSEYKKINNKKSLLILSPDRFLTQKR